MKKRVLIGLLAVLMIAASVFGLTACNNSNDEAITNLQQQITALENENKNLSEIIDKLEEENKTLSDKIDNLENENKNLLDKIENMEGEIKNLLDRIKDLEDKNKPILDETMATEIKTAYANKYDCQVEKISLRFYGEYNGAYVSYFVVSGFGYGMIVTRETVDNVEFVYSCDNKLEVYYDGNFYSLQEAFDNGYLTHNNLVAIKELTGEYITLG